MKWEYSTIDLVDSSPYDWNRYLDEYGKNGWRLKLCVPIPERKMLRIIFEKPLEQKVVTS